MSANMEDIIVSGITNEIIIKGSQVDFSQAMSGEREVSVGWDEEIWRHWDGTEKTL